MAVFRAPRITTTQRLALVLQEAEVVYDVNQQIYYGGDGVLLGGFPIGSNAGSSIEPEIIPITSLDVTNKYVTLSSTPLNSNAVRLNMVGGIEQLNGIDFTVTGNILSWDGLGLDGFIDDTDILIIQY